MVQSILIALVLLALFLYFIPLYKVPTALLIDGSIKSGKSFTSVYIAIKEHKKNLLFFRIKKFLFALIGKKTKEYERPILYSNIPIFKYEYTPLTTDIILRKKRLNNKSIVLIDEASLLADSMMYKDKDINERIMLFIKLFGHATHGGKLILNTQAISDLHYNIKRCISKYCYIEDRKKFPLISIVTVRDLVYTEDNANVSNSINLSNDKKQVKRFIIPNSYYKRYDCYCYSILTDSLPIYIENKKVINRKDLKISNIVSFRKWESEVLNNVKE